MKTSALKIIIKEAVKEAIQEELKDILLEAVRTPKVITQSPIIETTLPVAPTIPQTPTMSSADKRAAYQNILGNTEATFTSNNAQSFQPQAGMDTANGTLPAGEVDMGQIMGLMQK
jgi:hypothetical protein|tara:strand:- start:2722 stop:3069 length:348 start_codon:yes stop_codon:yes gene_type:complete